MIFQKYIEIESLEKMQNCIYVKPKESGSDLLLDVMIEKNMIPIDSE